MKFHKLIFEQPNGHDSNEKGIALLFTLGFLSLLMVLGVAFATTAITAKKLASSNNDVTSARLMAMGTLEKIIGISQFYYSGLPYSRCDSDTHSWENSWNQETTDWLHRLNTLSYNSTNSHVFKWEDDYFDFINWEYLYADFNNDNDFNPQTGGGARIVGRSAYVIIPGSGIDPVNAVKIGVDEGGNNEARLGVEVNEINLQNIDPDVITTALATKMSYDPIGKLDPPPPGSWTDFETMFSPSKLDITSNTIKEKFRTWFVLNTSKEPEAYWIDDNGDSKIDVDPTDDSKNELYNRYNLARMDWNAITLSDIIPKTMGGTWPNHTDEYGTAASFDGAGIPWLDNWTDKGTFPNAAARAKQIAANLKDYCDSDSVPTTDYNSGPPEILPTYCGLELVPYINDVRLRFDAAITKQVDTPIPGKYTYTLSNVGFKVRIEAINCYNLNYADLGDVRVAYTIKAKMNDGLADPSPSTLSNTGDYSESDWTVGPCNARTYKRTNNLDVSGSLFNDTYVSDQNMTPNLTITSIQLKIFLKNSVGVGGNLIDYAEIDNRDATFPAITFTNPDATNRYMYVKYEINDPRQNHHPGDGWTASMASTGPSLNPLLAGYWSGTGKNSNCNPNPLGNKDLETAADLTGSPWAVGDTVSTWYIRNDRIQSPWELGAIHRGAEWETLNLKKYCIDAALKPNRGGGPYQNGDAHLLDQIKMTSDTKSDKKVSLKLQDSYYSGGVKGILSALIRKIKIGATYDAPSGSGTIIDTGTDIWNIVNEIQKNSINFYSRARVANISKLFDGTCGVTQDSDAEQEELIGKFINLTSVSPTDYFTIIVLAQCVKDIGDGVMIRKDLDMNGSIGTANELTFGSDINGNNNATDTSGTSLNETLGACAYAIYNQHADEITGEQKIIAQIYRNPDTGKCKILRLEYGDE